jgi:hypothetical protein
METWEDDVGRPLEGSEEKAAPNKPLPGARERKNDLPALRHKPHHQPRHDLNQPKTDVAGVTACRRHVGRFKSSYAYHRNDSG